MGILGLQVGYAGRTSLPVQTQEPYGLRSWPRNQLVDKVVTDCWHEAETGTQSIVPWVRSPKCTYNTLPIFRLVQVSMPTAPAYLGNGAAHLPLRYCTTNGFHSWAFESNSITKCLIHYASLIYVFYNLIYIFFLLGLYLSQLKQGYLQFDVFYNNYS